MAGDKEFVLTDQDLRFLATMMNEETGIQLSVDKRDMIYGRLAKRLRSLHLADFAEYCRLLQAPGAAEEMTHCINALTTNHTHFFREGHHFDQLKEVMRQLSKKPRIRLWSAASSIGAEAYSMAMCIDDVLADAGSRDLRILGTDIDTQVIAKAAEGRFPLDMAAPIPSAYRKKYTKDIDAHTFEVAPHLRRMVAFKYLNLLEAWPIKGRFDVIFCRNVVIYFDKPTQARLFERLADALEPGGWLFIGHSENLAGSIKRFRSAGKTAFQRID